MTPDAKPKERGYFSRIGSRLSLSFKKLNKSPTAQNQQGMESAFVNTNAGAEPRQLHHPATPTAPHLARSGEGVSMTAPTFHHPISQMVANPSRAVGESLHPAPPATIPGNGYPRPPYPWPPQNPTPSPPGAWYPGFVHDPAMATAFNGGCGENPSSAPAATTSFLPGARHVQMGNIQYLDAPNAQHITLHATGNAHGNSVDGWDLLLKHTAPNALHNSDARYDPPKCDEDTRVEVTSEIVGWINDRESPQRLLCMTGAAGAGKSAIQQTIAEICAGSNTLAAAFFFSAIDPTRNTVSSVVPTIAFQLGSSNPTLRQLIGATIAQDPLIFQKALPVQMDALIARPMKSLQDRTGMPYAILIDGLDECKQEKRQAALLSAIRQYLLSNDLPFRLFIASRPEWAIHTALQPDGDLHAMAYHIQLSDEYDATNDIRRYLWRNLARIGRRSGNPEWFTREDVETLVNAASGMFIYAATVVKYLSDPRGSPVERLKVVLTWTPRTDQYAQPFAALDVLYANILSTAKETYEAIDTHRGRNFLLLFRTYLLSEDRSLVESLASFAIDFLTAMLNLESKAEEILLSDLRSLVALKRVPDTWDKFPLSEQRRDQLSAVIWYLPRSILAFMEFNRDDLNELLVDFTRKDGWRKIGGLLPLVDRQGTFTFRHGWANSFDHIIAFLKDKQPEVAAAMGSFCERWQADVEEWDREDEERKGPNPRPPPASYSDISDSE
ncbi:hypothetical protein EST38_g5742 [Candolleomyces aberdarensis]|uniref:Nephrocystin 3-like N-terminal domain-containing protein n=1 Tax=Candolleomyces aberdarensis TaxID=2316362 RepID=A0A4Q2DLF9_9AGAR|nr:hypothetical protein EST38_g5742 [Candolleomyces aberdarensis]